MKMRQVLTALLGTALLATQALAQQKTVTGNVSREGGIPLAGVAVTVKGTGQGTMTNNAGDFSIRAEVGQVLSFRRIGYLPRERTVGAENTIRVILENTAAALDQVVVTALGQTTVQRNLGTSQQTVAGADIAQTGRENFVNSLQGRVAGVEVTSTSGVPGASSSITIRGVSSISSSNQPLMVIDGLPMDNKTLNTNVLASDAPGSVTAFNNRGLDFTNRAADIDPENIESMVVLKGPEASALYGIDAANGAIVITTKRGRVGGGLEYSNRFRVDQTRARPTLQRTYGPSTISGGTLGAFSYFGAPYSAGTTFYDNIDGFFQPAMTQHHNLAFSGASADSRLNYRISVSADNQGSVVPNSDYRKVNLSGATQAQVTSWLKADLSIQYAQSDNSQVYKGTNGPLIGLLLWPQTDNASDYLTPAGTRRRITNLAASTETDNPYFNVDRNAITSTNGRLIANFGLVLTPFSWGDIRATFGSDGYTNENQILRHPESVYGNTYNGVLDLATDVTRNLNSQTILNLHSRKLVGDFSISGLVGNSISDLRSQANALKGQDFLDPNFVSINNTVLRTNRTTLAQRRLVSAYGQATLSFRDYMFVNVTGRNDWTSTIPTERNSFFYPSVSSSFVFSDAFPSVAKYVTGKLRAAYAEVGKDARPYAYRPSLESKTTANGGYGYGFTGPNLALKPEFARSYEFGAELSFLQDRLGLDVTWYRKQTRDQIVNDIRGSYATGFILFNLNGAVTRNEGTEITLRARPVVKRGFTWDVLANFEHAWGKVLRLPNALPESYVSDTWLFGNIRNGTAPGLSTRSLTGQFYLRNTAGKLLIDPTTGLPLRSTAFVDAGYDRQPDFTIGLTNTFRYKRFSLNFLVDIRKGGDVFNATEQFLTSRGLSNRTLDRDQARVIDGVLRDGKENSATPTANNIVVLPSSQTAYYENISEELFIERNINWVRLRDVTLRFSMPGKYLMARDASVFVTGTDLFVFTNYTGLDPIVNGNTAAVGGSGASGIDYGNFPIPRGLAFGLTVRY
ncbi:MAG: SusC/RagA family TonB-linked outer membrane protein [Gemmatimonadaceae bacterium]|nr:SusC/RagA family TonB-linked outer membrane protein [Gemmatimonadaceae bacterium]